MTFRIEYLTEPTKEDSICFAFVSKAADIDAAEAEGLAGAESARSRGATGFQVRHLNAVDKIVSIVELENGA